ncbi:sensor domain-containing protein [Nocardia yamanashiensis]|uniref:sensor histidine kinase n=1 Tax=Nocardia yamanashiensis TaxID=209247 RepID=UPI001E5C2FEF|nr:sensor domain-containing protein [Nocardia yamanashiensis]UGT40792.1 sensor domain-containing protein [Nocardia yamanashiensis]
MGDMTEPAENPSPAADRPTLDRGKSASRGDQPTRELAPAASVNDTRTLDPATAANDTRTLDPATAANDTRTLDPATATNDTRTLDPATATNDTRALDPATAANDTRTVDSAAPIDQPRALEAVSRGTDPAAELAPNPWGGGSRSGHGTAGVGGNPTLALDPGARSEYQPTMALGYGTPPGGQPSAAAGPMPTRVLGGAEGGALPGPTATKVLDATPDVDSSEWAGFEPAVGAPGFGAPGGADFGATGGGDFGAPGGGDFGAPGGGEFGAPGGGEFGTPGGGEFGTGGGGEFGTGGFPGSGAAGFADAVTPAERTAVVAKAMLTAPFRARTWKEFAYLVCTFVLGGMAAAYLFLGWGGGLYLSIFLIGIPVVALVLLGGRVWGTVYRGLARTLLGRAVAAPPPFRSTGLIGFFKSAFTDRTAWRALVFLATQVLIALFTGYVVLMAMLVAAFTALSPIAWAIGYPSQVDADGVEHHALAQFGDVFIDTWPKVIAFSLLGWITLWLMPWVVRAVCLVQGWLTATLLGPTNRDLQITELRESRRAAVDDSAATLRRLERDLHDGTQARLVTIAMALGRAEERLAAGGDARDLIADARASSKEALTELRELVRGIHPPALELGLEPALETLAARCSIPVELRVFLPHRPSPAIEAIAYFSVAELLTNVVKHAGANRIWVSVLPTGAGSLAVSVRDNGHGGALQPVAGTRETVVAGGLSGLAARARSVDGYLLVDSPAGGPTVVTMTLPIAGPL